MYIFCIFVIIAIWEVAKARKADVRKRNMLIYISGAILFLFAALRHEYVGGDIPRYFINYKSMLNTSFHSAISRFSDGSKDPGYYFMAWFCGRFFENPQWWIAFISAFYMIAIIKVIQRYSIDPCLSFVAFLMLGFFSFSLTGLRQTIAMAITLLAFPLCTERKLVKFIPVILLASLFHKTALLFFVAYPIYNLKFSKWHIIAICIAIIGFIFFKPQIREFMFEYINDSSFDTYSNYQDSEKEYTLMNFYIQSCMLVFTMFYYKKVIEKYESAVWLYNMAIIGVVFQLFASMLAEIFRLSMYFSIANIFLIPMAVSTEKNAEMRKMEYLMITAVLLLYICLRGNIQYKFFWQ